MHITTINKNRDEFEREQVGVHVRISQERKRRGNCLIIFQSQKIKYF